MSEVRGGEEQKDHNYVGKSAKFPILLTRIVTVFVDSNTRKLVDRGTRFGLESGKVPRFLGTFSAIHSCTLTLGS